MPVDLSGPLRSEFERAKEAYEKALAAGNSRAATEQANKCARLLRLLANNIPQEGKFYLEKAKLWEERAKGIEEAGLKEPQRLEETAKSAGLEFKSYIESLISTSEVTWKDIGGLEEPKRLLQETVVIDAMQKPEGIKPWRGILLYGPPGTGKSLLAAAAAGSLRATFFNVSADKMLSKYFGESSRLIAALYEVAMDRAPSIIFMDELDALTLSRSKDVDESTRRVLSTLLAQMDGFKSKKNPHLVLTLAATNSPWDMDTAALDRFPARIYVPLPDAEAAAEIVRINTKGLDISGINRSALGAECEKRLYSGRVISYLCQEAIRNMIRQENKDLHKMSEQSFEDLAKRALKTRPLNESDFEAAFKKVKVTLTIKELERFKKWADEFGG